MIYDHEASAFTDADEIWLRAIERGDIYPDMPAPTPDNGSVVAGIASLAAVWAGVVGVGLFIAFGI